jgi:hypothetical protein
VRGLDDLDVRLIDEANGAVCEPGQNYPSTRIENLAIDRLRRECRMVAFRCACGGTHAAVTPTGREARRLDALVRSTVTT